MEKEKNIPEQKTSSVQKEEKVTQPKQKQVEKNVIEELKQEEKKTPNYSYIGVLEMPKINVERGFLNINDKGNNVNKNLQVIKGSDMPDVKNGNLIIAAHSGNSYISYFKNLYKLSNDDVAYIYFNNIKYTYKVAGKYDVEKTGKVVIHRDNKKNTLTLITCSQTDKTKQIVYILELESEEGYE